MQPGRGERTHPHVVRHFQHKCAVLVPIFCAVASLRGKRVSFSAANPREGGLRGTGTRRERGGFVQLFGQPLELGPVLNVDHLGGERGRRVLSEVSATLTLTAAPGRRAWESSTGQAAELTAGRATCDFERSS